MLSQVILLSGKQDPIKLHLQKLFGTIDIVIVPLDEKEMVRWKKMLQLLRKERNNITCFACKDLILQRYQFILKTYLLLAKAKRRLLIDESGRMITFSRFKYFCYDFPHFTVEVFMSLWILLSTSVLLPFVKKSVLKVKRNL
jgi:hypothetical protein